MENFLINKIFKNIATFIVILSICIPTQYVSAYSKPTLFDSTPQAQKHIDKNKPAISFANILTQPNLLDISTQYGSILQWHKGKPGRIVIHIQDRHIDQTAQLNISHIIKELNSKYEVFMLMLEGASDEIDTSFYDQFSYPNIKEKISRFFLKKGIFTGAEYYQINNKEHYLKALGAEDKNLYFTHLKQYKASQLNKEQAVKNINSIIQTAQEAKSKIFSKQLQQLDNKINAYRNDKLELKDYAEALYAYADNLEINLPLEYPNFFQFHGLVEKESKIDFAKAQHERDELIQKLSEELSKEQLQDFLKISFQFKLSGITEKEFYNYLQENLPEYFLKEKAGSFKNLFAYIEYVNLSHDIDTISLFSELDELIYNLQKALCKNETQIKLFHYAEAAYLMSELFELKLTNKNISRINSESEYFDIEKIISFLNSICMKYKIKNTLNIPDYGVDKECFGKSIDFYKTALKRDAAMIDKTLMNMEKYNKDKAILVAGGFHTQGITNILEEKDISYVVICPNLSLENCDEIYQARMQGALPGIEEFAEFFNQTLSPPLITSGMQQAEQITAVQRAFAMLFGIEQEAVENDARWQAIDKQQLLSQLDLTTRTKPDINLAQLQDIILDIVRLQPRTVVNIPVVVETAMPQDEIKLLTDFLNSDIGQRSIIESVGNVYSDFQPIAEIKIVLKVDISSGYKNVYKIIALMQNGDEYSFAFLIPKMKRRVFAHNELKNMQRLKENPFVAKIGFVLEAKDIMPGKDEICLTEWIEGRTARSAEQFLSDLNIDPERQKKRLAEIYKMIIEAYFSISSEFSEHQDGELNLNKLQGTTDLNKDNFIYDLRAQKPRIVMVDLGLVGRISCASILNAFCRYYGIDNYGVTDYQHIFDAIFENLGLEKTKEFLTNALNDNYHKLPAEVFSKAEMYLVQISAQRPAGPQETREVKGAHNGQGTGEEINLTNAVSTETIEKYNQRIKIYYFAEGALDKFGGGAYLGFNEATQAHEIAMEEAVDAQDHEIVEALAFNMLAGATHETVHYMALVDEITHHTEIREALGIVSNSPEDVHSWLMQDKENNSQLAVTLLKDTYELLHQITKLLDSSLNQEEKTFFDENKTSYINQMKLIIAAALIQNKVNPNIKQDIRASLSERVSINIKAGKKELFSRQNRELREVTDSLLADLQRTRQLYTTVEEAAEKIQADGAEALLPEHKEALEILYKQMLLRNPLTGLYIKLAPGDRIITFNQMQLKLLNTALSMEGNNKVIAKRQQVLIELLKREGLINTDDEIISLSWKQDSFVIKHEVIERLGIDGVVLRLDRITAQLASITDRFIDEEFFDSQRNLSGKEANNLSNFHFTVYFGLSTPLEQEQDRNKYLKNLVSKNLEALQAAKMARKRNENTVSVSMGYVFNFSDIETLSAQTQDLLEDLASSMNLSTGTVDNEQIREKMKTIRELTENFLRQRVSLGREQARDYELKQFLNSIDFLFDFPQAPSGDLENLWAQTSELLPILETIKQIIEARAPPAASKEFLAQRILEGLSYVKTSTKDSNVTSRSAFHYYAVQRLEESLYIEGEYNGIITVIDVVDFWPKIQKIYMEMLEEYARFAQTEKDPQARRDKIVELAVKADQQVKQRVNEPLSKTMDIFQGLLHTVDLENSAQKQNADRDGGDEGSFDLVTKKALDFSDKAQLAKIRQLAGRVKELGIRAVMAEIDYKRRGPDIGFELTHAQTTHARSYTTASAADVMLKDLEKLGVFNAVLVLKAKQSGGFDYYVVTDDETTPPMLYEQFKKHTEKAKAATAQALLGPIEIFTARNLMAHGNFTENDIIQALQHIELSAFLYRAEPAYRPGEYREFLRKNNIALAVVNNHIAGFIITNEREKGVFEIDTLAVSEPYQANITRGTGYGIGSALMDKVMEIIIEQSGFTRSSLYLDSTADGFYQLYFNRRLSKTRDRPWHFENLVTPFSEGPDSVKPTDEPGKIQHMPEHRFSAIIVNDALVAPAATLSTAVSLQLSEQQKKAMEHINTLLTDAYDAFFGLTQYRYGLIIDTSTIITENDKQAVKLLASKTAQEAGVSKYKRQKIKIVVLTQQGKSLLITEYGFNATDIATLDECLSSAGIQVPAGKEQDMLWKIKEAAFALKADVGDMHPIGIISGSAIADVYQLADMVEKESEKTGKKGIFISSQLTPAQEAQAIEIDGIIIAPENAMFFHLMFYSIVGQFCQYIANPDATYSVLLELPPIIKGEAVAQILSNIRAAIEASYQA